MRSTNKVDEILDHLSKRIQANEFSIGGRLPSLRTLAADYNTSQETINKVLQNLQAHGLITSHGQKGLFVNAPRVRLPGIASHIGVNLKKLGLEVSVTYMEPPGFTTIPDEAAEFMKLPKDTQVLHRLRKLEVGNIVYRIVESVVVKEYISPEMTQVIERDPSYDLLGMIEARFKLGIRNIHEEIFARLPTIAEQENLRIVRNNPVIELKRTLHTEKDNKPVIFHHQILNANHFLLSYDYNVTHWEK